MGFIPSIARHLLVGILSVRTSKACRAVSHHRQKLTMNVPFKALDVLSTDFVVKYMCYLICGNFLPRRAFVNTTEQQVNLRSVDIR
jgi:hypothetical protein